MGYIMHTSSARTSRGRKFQRKKTISQRKNLPIECAQDQRDAQTISLLFHGGDVTCFNVTKLLAA